MIEQNQRSGRDFMAVLIPEDWKNEALKLEYHDNFETREGLLSIGTIKRFLERWHADPEFRDQVSAEPCKAATCYGLNVNPEKIRPLWDKEFATRLGEEIPALGSWKAVQEFSNKIMLRTKYLAASSSNPNFKFWRERQIARTENQFLKKFYVTHIPVCFELSKGCSVGCHFCGVSAPHLGNIFTYNQENAKLWREVLELMKEILGPAASVGFCYWATEPLDNPDYEKFCSDFHKVLGTFPQTSTAQPMKDPARTRALLKLSREKGCLANRFSILSLKMLNQVHKEFSAEDLTFVNLALQNEEADSIKANAGRVRERNIRKGKDRSEPFDQGTIACVSGFLFNMVDRSVKLISPCNADERWPLGYMIYDEGNFSNVDELNLLLERMINDNMPLTVRADDLMSFRRELKYENLPDGFQLSTKIKTLKFHNYPYLNLRKLGEVVHKGDKTAEEIASLFDICGVSSAHTFHTLNFLFERGVLDDEPKPKDLN